VGGSLRAPVRLLKIQIFRGRELIWSRAKIPGSFSLDLVYYFARTWTVLG